MVCYRVTNIGIIGMESKKKGEDRIQKREWVWKFIWTFLAASASKFHQAFWAKKD
jgi:hypothetical protein